MPHYRDGTEAKIGDRVRGCGYNHESRGYDPCAGIEGIVTEVRPGGDVKNACTLSVTYLRLAKAPHEGGAFNKCGVDLVADVEYGDTVCFDRVG